LPELNKIVNIDALLRNINYAQSINGIDVLTSQNTISVCLRDYLISCKSEGKTNKTLITYGETIIYFIRFLSSNNYSINITDITGNHIRQFLSTYFSQDNLSSTANSYYRVLRTFFNWIISEGIIEKSPMYNIKPPKIPKTIIKPFSNEDIKRLLVICSGNDFYDLRNKALIFLMLDTGLRLNEVSNILLNNIDFISNTIRVIGKGNKERIVRIGNITLKAIKAYLVSRRNREDKNIHLWVTNKDATMQPRSIQTLINRLCKRAEITDCRASPHTFRHTAAINYLRNSGDQFTLQIMLGHSTLEMTRRYVQSLGTEDMLRVHEKASPVDNLF